MCRGINESWQKLLKNSQKIDEQFLKTNMNIDLNNTNHLPKSLRHKLESTRDLCQQEEFSEKLVKHDRVCPLVTELNDFCMSNLIIGIHYTRADKARIEKQGLLLRSGEDIRKTFIQEYGKRFTDKEISEIASRWDDYFCDEQTRYRDFCVFFNFTEDALSNGGAEYLLKLYGGEQVLMCFRDNDCSIGKKLGQIGEPLLR